MARHKRMVDKPSRFKANPVTTRTIYCGRGWSLPQAADLIRQGYSSKYASQRTGYPAKVVECYYAEHGGFGGRR